MFGPTPARRQPEILTPKGPRTFGRTIPTGRGSEESGLVGVGFLFLVGGDDLLREVLGHFLIAGEGDGVAASTGRHAAQVGRVSEYLGLGDRCADA